MDRSHDIAENLIAPPLPPFELCTHTEMSYMGHICKLCCHILESYAIYLSVECLICAHMFCIYGTAPSYVKLLSHICTDTGLEGALTSHIRSYAELIRAIYVHEISNIYGI